jgi:hypothetical protein
LGALITPVGVAYAKRSWARVWQSARFKDDVDFWTSRLGDRCDVTPLTDGQSLRFRLFDESDFSQFKKAVSMEMPNIEFYGVGEVADVGT